MTHHRYDPVGGRWRAYADLSAADPAAVAEPEHCPLCLAPPGTAASPSPAERYQVAVLHDPPGPAVTGPPVPSCALYPAGPVIGTGELIGYADRHGTGLADLPEQHLARLVDVWADRYAVLGGHRQTRYVLIEEDQAGAAPPLDAHPHGWVHALADIPPAAREELDAARRHRDEFGTCVYCDVIGQERADGARIIAGNEYLLAFVPFAPRTPFEVHVAAHRHVTSLLDLSDPERDALAALLGTVLTGYRTLLGPEAAHVMEIHQAPTGDETWLPLSHLHLELSPRHPASGPGGRASRHAGGPLGPAPEQAAVLLREAMSAGLP